MSCGNNVVKKSEAERMKSCQLRSNIDNAVNGVRYETYEAWENTNKALDKRTIEILEAKEKLQIYLHQIREKILSIEKSMKLMQKTVGKNSELKVANMRLEIRIYNPEIELCNNHVTQSRIIKEVKDINKICDMNLKLQQLEAQHQQLLRMKSNLENDLKSKTNALFIDKEK